MLLILIDISPFFKLTPFPPLEQLLEPLWELPMDNLEKAFSLLFWYRGQERTDSRAQGAQAWQLSPVVQEELACVVSGLKRSW